MTGASYLQICRLEKSPPPDKVRNAFNRSNGCYRFLRHLLGGTAILSLSVACFSGSASAETTDPKVQAQIDALVAEIKALRAEVHEQSKEHRATQVKIKEVETRVKSAAKVPSIDTRATASAEPIVKGPLPVFAWDKKIHLGLVTITPGGFFEGAGVWRQHAEQADLASNFTGLPFPNSSLYHMSETRFSMRSSRPAVLVEGQISPSTIVSGYAEFDFFGAAHTASNVESSSYNPRVRNLYATLDMDDPGIHILAGQSWTMLNLDGKGIVPRSEVFAPFIDADFIPGQLWERGAQVRFVKDFDKTFWVGLSLENPQTTFASCPGSSPSGAVPSYLAPATGYGALGNGIDVYCQSPGASFNDTQTNFSFNRIPDIVGKVAWDGHVGANNVHLEAEGVYSEFYDRVAAGGAVSGGFVNGFTPLGNKTTSGYGVGVGMVAQVIPKWLDFEGQVFGGRGIGRYGTSLLPGATFNPDGSISAIPEVMMLSSLTLHATPKLDFWVGGGFEREFGNYFQYGPGAYFGVGAPNANNSGCNVESGSVPAGATTCAGNTKQIWQITGGFWDKIYEGGFGQVRVGVQYSYTQRELFAGSGSSAGLPAFIGSPKTGENMVLTSLRYYPFQ